MKNIEFMVLETLDHDSFEISTQTYLRDGWDFHGSLIAFPNNTSKDGVQIIKYIQAFIRKKSFGEITVVETGDEFIN